MFKNNSIQLQDSPVAKLLFGDTRLSILWLVLRVYLGYQWLDAVSHKLSDPAWYQTGQALKGFWAGAVKVPQPPAHPAIAFDWYRNFLQYMINSGAYTWFAKLVIAGELLVGICMILGAFVGIAAFAGAFMNWNFIMAGSASSNGLLLAIAIFLILAWKTAGWIGLDHYLLPLLGTPWAPGRVFGARKPEAQPVAAD